MDKEITRLSKVNSLYREMIHDVVRLRNLDFSQLREPRIGYAEQTAIQQSRMDMATACAIHYSLHPGMTIRYAKGEYVGENREVTQILRDVSPHVDETNVVHIKRILTQGCPAISFEETTAMKASIIMKGNQATFQMYPEIVTKRMNKEDRHSHLLPMKLWVLHFSPHCRHMAQGMQVKPGKNPRIIFDASTKSHPHEVVLNKITTTEFKANITFGLAKLKLLQRIYNWRVSHQASKVYLAPTDITACFCFPRIHPDVRGAFGFMAKNLYFLATSMVFGSNTSASSWEPFRKAIEALLIEYLTRSDLIKKHKHLLDMLVWEDNNTWTRDLVQAVKCPLSPGIPDLDGNLEAYIYVDDILASATARNKNNILRLLIAIIKAIFTICDCPNVELCQCPLSLEKWMELVVGLVQTVLGLTVDTNRLTVGITQEYQNQVKDLLDKKWPISRQIFKVAVIQKLVGKMAHLGKGAPWIFKLMPHIYTSLAFALKQNKALFLACSPKFQELVDKIERKQFSGNQSEIAKELNFALKTAAKLVNGHKQVYAINKTRQAELDFIRQALNNDSGIAFEAPIAFIIPRTPMATLFGDSLLRA